jgi:hypothetical protein
MANANDDRALKEKMDFMDIPFGDDSGGFNAMESTPWRYAL